jgi:mannose-1-phosphate guanylyltransferase/phosphomannomutase
MNKAAAKVRHAVILAAGKSRRLQSLKLDKPKPLIEVKGKPLLEWHLKNCAIQGIEEVFINLHHLPDQIRSFAGDGSRWGLKINYHYEPVLAGTSGALKNFDRYLRGEPFLVIYGDNYCTFSLQEIIESHFAGLPRPQMSMVLFHLADVSGSGVAICAPDHSIQSFIEKPTREQTKSHWVNAGVYLLEPELLDLIPNGVSDFGHEVIPGFLAAGKRILGVKTQGRVYAVDTPELLRRVAAPTEL